MKGTKLGMVAVDAIVHMIGQTEDLMQRGATMAEIASWLNVSKPTAKRFIETHHIGIDVHMIDWRKGHSIQYIYTLSAPKRSAYERGVFKKSYQVYVGTAFGVWMK